MKVINLSNVAPDWTNEAIADEAVNINLFYVFTCINTIHVDHCQCDTPIIYVHCAYTHNKQNHFLLPHAPFLDSGRFIFSTLCICYCLPFLLQFIPNR